MSSTERHARRTAAFGLLLLGSAWVTSVSYSPEAVAQDRSVEAEPVVSNPTVQVAAFSAMVAAYGWIATKTYDLGKEIGKSMVGAADPVDTLIDPTHEYLLD